MRANSLFLLLLYPAAVLMLVLIAALHTWLGAPLGPLFASELWGLVKSTLITLVAYGPIGAMVQAANARAAAQAAPTQAAPPPSSYKLNQEVVSAQRPHRIQRSSTGSLTSVPRMLNPSKEDHADNDDDDPA